MPDRMSPVPIYVMLIVFSMLAGAMFALVPPKVGNDILDGFVIAATLIGAYRFGPYGAESIFERRPNGPNFMVASAFIICVAICLIRMLRLVGVELGIITSSSVNYAFGAITALMAFGIMLLVASPELRQGKLMLDRAVAMALFVVLAGVLSVAVYLFRIAV